MSNKKKIEITEVPPGFAPERIRKGWVGIKIELPTEEELENDLPTQFGIGTDNLDGYTVFTFKAIEALEAANKDYAVDYWKELPIGKFLRFSKDCCRPVEE